MKQFTLLQTSRPTSPNTLHIHNQTVNVLGTRKRQTSGSVDLTLQSASSTVLCPGDSTIDAPFDNPTTVVTNSTQALPIYIVIGENLNNYCCWLLPLLHICAIHLYVQECLLGSAFHNLVLTVKTKMETTLSVPGSQRLTYCCSKN